MLNLPALKNASVNIVELVRDNAGDYSLPMKCDLEKIIFDFKNSISARY